MMGTLKEMLSSSERIVFLTGAGVSVPSGIPDYRSKNGLYTGRRNPEYLLSATCLREEPDVFLCVCAGQYVLSERDTKFDS